MKTAAILVGGKGTRLQSIVSHVPKPLAPVAGEPFLFLILRALKQAGISRVVLLTGYMHEKIVEACQDGSQFGLEIIYSRETEFLGTAGALKNAETYLQNEFLLLNGDTYLDCALEELIHYPLSENVQGVIGVSQPDDGKRYGNILLNGNQIISFREKDENATGWVSAGIYKFSADIFRLIPKNQAISLEVDIFPALVNKLHAVKLAGDFCDIGVPESYLAFQEKFI